MLLRREGRRSAGSAQRSGAAGSGEGSDERGGWSTVESGDFGGHAAGFVETAEIRLHGLVFAENSEGFAQDFGGSGAGRDNDPIVHPLPFAPDGDYAGPSEVGEVAGDFGLTLAEHFDEVADADLAAVHEVEESEAGAVGEGGKEERQVVALGRAIHAFMIYALTDMSSGEYIRLSVCKEDFSWDRRPAFRNR
jgi:hypothetical protein